MRQLKRRDHAIVIIMVLLLASCGDNNKPIANAPVEAAPQADQVIPKIIGYDIVREYPHDSLAFTEGLEYKDGYLYESTGEYGESDIRKVELATGKVVYRHKLEDKYFGEGLTIVNDKIYQLTYREGRGFVYDLATLRPVRNFSFNTTEGWGMTNNGSLLIFDDGTNVLHFLDPATFAEVKKLSVTDEHGPVQEINEPEMIKGFIYANQWETDNILKIDTATGHVVGRADLSTLRQRAGIPPPAGMKHQPDVLNGIAYDAAGNRIFITGKNWPKLFEIRLDN